MAYLVSIRAYVRFVLLKVVETRPFVLVKRYGVARAIVCIGRRPQVLATVNHPWLLALAIVSIPIANFIVAALALGGVSMALEVHPRSSQLFSVAILDIGRPLVWGSFLVVGWMAWRYLSHMACPGRSGGLVTPIAFPQWMSQPDRAALASLTFWRAHTGLFLAGIALLPTLGFVDFGLTQTVSTGQTAAAAATVFIPAAIVCLLAKRFFDRSMAGADAAVMICGILDEDQRAQTSDSAPASAPARDIRDDLSAVCQKLSLAADHLDARQRPGFTPHPMATTMRAIAHKVTISLTGREALHSKLSKDTALLLNDTVILLASSQREDEASRIADNVEAFDAQGRPAANGWSKPQGRLAMLAARAGQRVEHTAQTLTRVSAVIAAGVAVVLFATGKLDLASLLLYLPGK